MKPSTLGITCFVATIAASGARSAEPQLRLTSEIQGIAIAADFSVYVARVNGGDRFKEDFSLKVVKVNTGEDIRTIQWDEDWGKPYDNASLSPDGKKLAVLGSDFGGIPTARIFDVTTGQLIANVQHELLEAVMFLPDSKRLASIGGVWTDPERNLWFWDVTTRRKTVTVEVPTQPRCLAFSPDGKRLVCGHSRGGSEPLVPISLCEVSSGRRIATLAGHSDTVTSVAFSPDGKTIASASRDRSLKLWNAARRTEVKTLEGHLDEVCSIAFGSDGKNLASLSKDKTIRLWDVRAGTTLAVAQLEDLPNDSTTLLFSSDGRQLAVKYVLDGYPLSGGNERLVLWNVEMP